MAKSLVMTVIACFRAEHPGKLEGRRARVDHDGVAVLDAVRASAANRPPSPRYAAAPFPRRRARNGPGPGLSRRRGWRTRALYPSRSRRSLRIVALETRSGRKARRRSPSSARRRTRGCRACAPRRIPAPFSRLYLISQPRLREEEGRSLGAAAEDAAGIGLVDRIEGEHAEMVPIAAPKPARSAGRPPPQAELPRMPAADSSGSLPLTGKRPRSTSKRDKLSTSPGRERSRRSDRPSLPPAR